MATDDNTPPSGGSNYLRIDARRLVFEVGIILDSVGAGLENLGGLPEAKPIVEQIGFLRKLVDQASEALEAFGELLKAHPVESSGNG